MWGSDGISYYWTDGATELLRHQFEPRVQGDGGSNLFWNLVTAEEPGYGSNITEKMSTQNTEVYIDILPTSLLMLLNAECSLCSKQSILRYRRAGSYQ